MIIVDKILIRARRDNAEELSVLTVAEKQ